MGYQIVSLEIRKNFTVIKISPFPVPIIILVHSTHIHLPMKMEETECSETSAYKLHTPGNYPKESVQHTERGESLKSGTRSLCWE